jgi:hypothetical protein
MSDELSEDIKDRMRRIANDFKRQELTEKYGAIFPPDENPDLPPEVENEWLNTIEAFEQQYENAARITVRAFVGEPDVQPLCDVPPEHLEAELNRLLDVLGDHNVAIDFIYEIEMAEAYRFIVEELLDEEMDDIRIPDMWHHFVYEEFHPNDREDAKLWAEEFYSALMMGDMKMVEITLGDQGLLDGQGRRMTLDEIDQAMTTFHTGYGTLRHFAVATEILNLHDDQAVVKATLTWHPMARSEDAPLTATLTTRLARNLYGGWDVVQADLPPGEV